jgi:hypothetical protein
VQAKFNPYLDDADLIEDKYYQFRGQEWEKSF